MPGFLEASRLWEKLYAASEGRAYAWRGRCNRHLADILREVGGVAAFQSVAAAFLADRWPGYDGHALKDLYRDLQKFSARAGRAAGQLTRKQKELEGWTPRNPTAEELAMIENKPG